VNFTKICLCFGLADVTQHVDMRSSKNLRLSKLLRLLFATHGHSSATHFGVATHRFGTTPLRALQRGSFRMGKCSIQSIHEKSGGGLKHRTIITYGRRGREKVKNHCSKQRIKQEQVCTWAKHTNLARSYTTDTPFAKDKQLHSCLEQSSQSFFRNLAHLTHL